jgi:hypothetical protein
LELIRGSPLRVLLIVITSSVVAPHKPKPFNHRKRES